MQDIGTGYLIILRPLLVLFNINQIRMILTILLVALAIILSFLIGKKINFITAMTFLMGLLGVEYFYLGFSLQGIFVFIIMMISSIIILLRYKKIKSFGLLFFITGILTNFFDFLTVPIVTLIIPLIIYFLLKQKEEILNLKIVFKELFFLTFAWGIGYGITWFTKWILVDLFFNKNMISVAINQVLYRSTEKTSMTTYNVFNVIEENLDYIIVPFFISVFCTFLIINLKILFNNYSLVKPNVNQLLNRILPYVIILLVPFCWYALLQNHSYYHAFFTYRNLIIVNISFNIIIIEIFLSFFKEEKNNEK